MSCPTVLYETKKKVVIPHPVDQDLCEWTSSIELSSCVRTCKQREGKILRSSKRK